MPIQVTTELKITINGTLCGGLTETKFFIITYSDYIPNFKTRLEEITNNLKGVLKTVKIESIIFHLSDCNGKTLHHNALYLSYDKIEKWENNDNTKQNECILSFKPRQKDGEWKDLQHTKEFKNELTKVIDSMFSSCEYYHNKKMIELLKGVSA